MIARGTGLYFTLMTSVFALGLSACTVDVQQPAPRPVYRASPPPVYYHPAPPPVAYEAPPAAYQPPPLRVEGIPPPPSGAYIWRPGHWNWTGYGNHYLWVRGEYVYHQPGWHQWVHGRWVPENGNWVWVPGHWA